MKLHIFLFGLIVIVNQVFTLSVADDSVLKFKNQKQSSVDWGHVNLDQFLSFSKWKDLSDERDLVPDWETISNERNHHEMIGKFFQCVGNCRIDRGESFFNPIFKSSLYEGDEVQTIGESYAWLFLFDGTMLRLSPGTSINLNEFNLGIKENFLSIRLNYGNVLWLSRSELPFEESNLRETDVLFNPIAVHEALPFPEKKEYNEDSLISLVEENQSNVSQYKRLNDFLLENNKITKGKSTYAFIVMPNATLMGYNPSLELVSLLSGKSFFKLRSNKALGLKVDSTMPASEDVFVQLRGYENKELTPIEPDKWLEVDESGRSAISATEHLNLLTMGEFITKRIPSLLIGREIMLTEFSNFCFRDHYDKLSLAKIEGYRLWGNLKSETGKTKEDLELRLDFLKEYFRRIETTNLTTSAHFNQKIKERGEKINGMEYSSIFFIKALDRYYSYEDYSDDQESGEVLNSTTKTLWKAMHGIR